MFLQLLVLVLYAVPFFFVFPHSLYLQFCLGLILGYVLFMVDRLLHVFFIQPESSFSQQVRASWQAGNWQQVIQLFKTGRDQQSELITRSLLFLIVYVGLAVYVLTSTGSSLGMGLILGIGLHTCVDFWRYRNDEVQFRQQFLWQLKRELTKQETLYFVGGFTLLFLVFSIILLL